MKKILYVHGYLGSANGKSFTNIKNCLPPGYIIEGIDYNETSAETAYNDILNYVNEHKPDIVIGTSLGAFLIMMLPENVKRIVVNPCYSPSEVLPTINATNLQIETYTQYELTKFAIANTEIAKHNIIGCFGDHDSLLGTKYISKFKTSWGNDNCVIINSDHSLSIEGAKQVTELITNF